MQTLAHNPANTWLDKAGPLPNNADVLFNSGTGIGVPNKKADTAAQAVFLRPYHATRASSSMAGRGGSIFGCAGPFLPVRQSRHAPATPDWRRDGGLTAQKGGHHA
jgi:hypothetical protein